MALWAPAQAIVPIGDPSSHLVRIKKALQLQLFLVDSHFPSALAKARR